MVKLGHFRYTLTREDKDILLSIYENMKGTDRQGNRTDMELLRDVMAMTLELVFCKVNDFLWINEISLDAWEEFHWDAMDKAGKTYDLKKQSPAWWAVYPDNLATLHKHQDTVDYVVTATMERVDGDTFDCNFIRVIRTKGLFFEDGLNAKYWKPTIFEKKAGQFLFKHHDAKPIIVQEYAA